MGETKNLSFTEGIQKIKDLAEAANTCHFISNLTELPLNSRPMATQKVDDEGNIWFFSKNDSNKNMDISKDDRVQLLYANNSNYEYLSIYGNATIITDRNKIKELWTPIAKTWFHEGKDDPTITLIKVEPHDAHYWDTKSNKMVSLLKIAVGAIVGKTLDNGVEGEIHL